MSRNKPKTRVRTSKKRKSSSTRWLQRQLNDDAVNPRIAVQLVQPREDCGLRAVRWKLMHFRVQPGCRAGLHLVADVDQRRRIATDFQRREAWLHTAPPQRSDTLFELGVDIAGNHRTFEDTRGHEAKALLPAGERTGTRLDDLEEDLVVLHHTEFAPCALFDCFEPLLEIAHLGIECIIPRLQTLVGRALRPDLLVYFPHAQPASFSEPQRVLDERDQCRKNQGKQAHAAMPRPAQRSW